MSEDAAPGSLGWFIDTVLLDQMQEMIVQKGFHYLGFGIVANGIEFLGACLDRYPFDEKGKSERRFKSAVTKLFDERYRPFVECTGNHNLYANLRCGMLHIMRPQGDVVFTHLQESKVEGTKHLEFAPGTTKLVLVSEVLYTDFAAAATTLKSQMEAGQYTKKASDIYLAVE